MALVQMAIDCKSLQNRSYHIFHEQLLARLIQLVLFCFCEQVMHSLEEIEIARHVLLISVY